MQERIEELLRDLEQYIQENWIAPDSDMEAEALRPEVRRDEVLHGMSLHRADEASVFGEDLFSKDLFSPMEKHSLSLEDLIGEVGATFHEVLFEKIARSGMTDVEVYRRANMDRKLFSKIRNNPAYHPGKNTVLALAIALKMNLNDTQDLLSRAEYALSPSSKSDVIIRYFIERKIFDIDLINIALDEHGMEILG